jgi:hypothetical protein
MDVSIALGLYVADKLTGPYKDTFLTFNDRPELQTLRGDIVTKVNQLRRAAWGMNTNIEAAFNLILDTAKRAQAPQSDMPDVLLILSDMQFDRCARYGDTMQAMMKAKYAAAGYKVPTVVFWNLNAAYGNGPATQFDQGVMMVSGFSPAILKAVLSASLDDISPWALMVNVLNGERYSPVVV